MPNTSLSLLQKVRTDPDPQTWQRLVDLYTPFLQHWLRKHDVQAHDADDLIQEVMTVVVREIQNFQYEPGRSSFRSWLRTILVNRVRNFWRKKSRTRPELGELEDPNSNLSGIWNQQHDQYIINRALELIQSEFEPATWRAFERVGLEGAKAGVVAAELKMTVNAVYIARSRVLKRLREEFQALAGDDSLLGDVKPTIA